MLSDTGTGTGTDRGNGPALRSGRGVGRVVSRRIASHRIAWERDKAGAAAGDKPWKSSQLHIYIINMKVKHQIRVV